ncbi:hypothetical protein AV530_005109 [Patagioenas fasciata monilis]|uniref:Uncharacterized protein n=1 Tax=Patagioenas fasciata monilis TaxID=372326 RepID=A0A1V4K448_PATFA|nr:hypothetical protein AV530_005109 [Patagioenas fasciata monilis]
MDLERWSFWVPSGRQLHNSPYLQTPYSKISTDKPAFGRNKPAALTAQKTSPGDSGDHGNTIQVSSVMGC